jgi:sRNA-binding protein
LSSTYRIERDRGINEYRQQLAELRKKWPLAFPANDQDARPLAVDATDEIAAVICHPQRIALDGSPAEIVGAKAKDLATKHLARRAAGKAAQKTAKRAAPAVVNPKSAGAPHPAPLPETPKQLRDRVRASLLRRRA